MDITIIITSIISVFTGVAGYLFGRRGANATAQGKELSNVEEALKIYRDILSDLSKRLETQALTIAHQQIEIQQLREKVNNLENNQ